MTRNNFSIVDYCQILPTFSQSVDIHQQEIGQRDYCTRFCYINLSQPSAQVFVGSNT